MSFATTASAVLVALSLQVAGRDDIAVQELGDIHPFEVDAGGTLPQSVWSSGDPEALRAVLIALPHANRGWRSDAASRLAAGVLLTGGTPPDLGRNRFTLSSVRINRALASGRPQPVLRLLERTPRINESEDLSQYFAELAFGLGHVEDACLAADALLEGRDEPYWLRARAACLAFSGNIAAAELTAELARAQTPDPEFDQLIDAFTLSRELPADFAAQTGLQLALAEALAPEMRIIPSDQAPQWLVRAAARTGPPISLPQTLPEALEAAVMMSGEERKVALGALIQQDLDREIASEALAIRLTDAAETDQFVEAAYAYGMEVARLPVTGDTLAHGRLFVLAALAADDVVAAERWREALVNGPPVSVPEPVTDPAPPMQPDGPSSLATPPGFAQDTNEALGPEWTPPPLSVLQSLDFAALVAAGRIETDAFATLLAERLDEATPVRVCEASALVALGADDGGALRAALTGLDTQTQRSSASLVPGLLAASSGALGESALHAALVLESGPDSAEACAGMAVILDRAGLDHVALRVVLELILEDAA